ncbi:KRAB-A domain-containing protein 2-like [Diabrotica undecimpunctata]|uniref:KRAB-A domain-containing protein 2-like n=1 Tax=Diabrotica undecimpunctata TaxID=50387 RepID=UPI003B6360D6
MWNELKIVHVKPRHSQPQGSVERVNQDIEKMLATWLETNKAIQWSEGIKFIQFMKNRAYHSGISCSTYEALSGCKAKVGLKTSLPAGTLTEIRSEEDLEAILADESDNANGGAKHRGNLDVISTTEDSQLANVEYPGNANNLIEYNTHVQ